MLLVRCIKSKCWRNRTQVCFVFYNKTLSYQIISNYSRWNPYITRYVKCTKTCVRQCKTHTIFPGYYAGLPLNGGRGRHNLWRVSEVMLLDTWTQRGTPSRIPTGASVTPSYTEYSGDFSINERIYVYWLIAYGISVDLNLNDCIVLFCFAGSTVAYRSSRTWKSTGT